MAIIQILYNKNTTFANPRIPTNYNDFLKFLSSLRIDEYANLLVEINLHRQFEAEYEYVQYWDYAEALVILNIDISKNSLNKAKDEFNIYKEGIDESVEEDTKKMLMSKIFEDLVQFEQKTKQELANSNLETEMSFWETMLKRIVVLKVLKAEKYFQKVFDSVVITQIKIKENDNQFQELEDQTIQDIMIIRIPKKIEVEENWKIPKNINN